MQALVPAPVTQALVPTFGARPLAVGPPLRLEPPAGLVENMVRRATPVLAPAGYTRQYGNRTKANLFHDYAWYSQYMNEAWDSNRKFVKTVIESNMEWKNGPGHKQWAEDTAAKFLDVAPPALGYQPLAEIALKDDAGALAHLNELLAHTAHGLVRTTLGVLDRMRASETIGSISWLSQQVCRFNFYRWITEELYDGRRFTTDGVATDFRRTFKHQVHLHEVMNAQVYPWNANVAMPPPVKEMLAQTPAMLQPFVHIVTGEEIFRAVLERELRSETRSEFEPYPVVVAPVYNYDPCVTLGGMYVLTGW